MLITNTSLRPSTQLEEKLRRNLYVEELRDVLQNRGFETRGTLPKVS